MAPMTRTSPFVPLRRAALALLAICCTLATAQAAPPAAPVRLVTDTYFGTAVPDPYRYLENARDPDVARWMKAQAEYTRQTLDRIPGRAALLKRIAELGDAAPARIANVQVSNGHYYYLKRLASENLPKLYVRPTLSAKERLLVDP
jgi:prolyl oligopeptidase